MSLTTLIIGGIEIPVYALTDDFRQDYEEIAGISSARMGDGSLLIQRAWPTAAANYKLRTTISGGGSLPAPLDSLNRGASVEISCAEPRRITGATPTATTITLPAGRRSDSGYAPTAWALVGGLLVSTPVSIATNTATVTAVSGAQHYHVRYWPKFSGLITHKTGGEPWQARRGWSVTLEEV
jgi:hypothetical protein